MDNNTEFDRLMALAKRNQQVSERASESLRLHQQQKLQERNYHTNLFTKPIRISSSPSTSSSKPPPIFKKLTSRSLTIDKHPLHSTKNQPTPSPKSVTTNPPTTTSAIDTWEPIPKLNTSSTTKSRPSSASKQAPQKSITSATPNSSLPSTRNHSPVQQYSHPHSLLVNNPRSNTLIHTHPPSYSHTTTSKPHSTTIRPSNGRVSSSNNRLGTHPSASTVGIPVKSRPLSNPPPRSNTKPSTNQVQTRPTNPHTLLRPATRPPQKSERPPLSSNIKPQSQPANRPLSTTNKMNRTGIRTQSQSASPLSTNINNNNINRPGFRRPNTIPIIKRTPSYLDEYETDSFSGEDEELEDDEKFVRVNMSSIIQSMMGRSRSQQRLVYDDDDDDMCMEVGYTDAHREELQSARLARIEDQRLEYEEKQRRLKRRKMLAAEH